MKPITGMRAPAATKNDVEPHTPGAAATEIDPQICTVCGYIIAPATGHIQVPPRTLVPAVEATCVDRVLGRITPAPGCKAVCK